jgi:hypothetical protein
LGFGTLARKVNRHTQKEREKRKFSSPSKKIGRHAYDTQGKKNEGQGGVLRVRVCVRACVFVAALRFCFYRELAARHRLGGNNQYFQTTHALFQTHSMDTTGNGCKIFFTTTKKKTHFWRIFLSYLGQLQSL